jgi:uncharacterized protein (TIGR03083 family)
MALSVEDCLAAITGHTRGLAVVAEGNLDARIEHCPDWSMADLVWHLTSVHWFWNQVAFERPVGEPDFQRPERPADDALIAAMLTGVATLADTLRTADQQAPCWTWGLEENVGFITRHQVQEAAVHHWDAANAIGAGWTMDDVAASDAVEEFLTQSVSNARWPNPSVEPLDGTLWLCACSDDGPPADAWLVSDGEDPGTLRHQTIHLPDPDPDIVGAHAGAHGTAAGFLLWLYRRITDEDLGIDGDQDIVRRFRAFASTD